MRAMHNRTGRIAYRAFELIAELRAEPRALAREPGTRKLRCNTHARDGGDILSAASTLALLRTPDRLRLASNRPSNVEGADTLRAMKLVRSETRKIHLKCREISRHLSNPLRRVGVETHAMFTTKCPKLRDVGDGTGFVVRPHEAHERNLMCATA